LISKIRICFLPLRIEQNRRRPLSFLQTCASLFMLMGFRGLLLASLAGSVLSRSFTFLFLFDLWVLPHPPPKTQRSILAISLSGSRPIHCNTILVIVHKLGGKSRHLISSLFPYKCVLKGSNPSLKIDRSRESVGKDRKGQSNCIQESNIYCICIQVVNSFWNLSYSAHEG